MVRKLPFLSLLLAILFSIPFLWHFSRAASRPLEEIDESAWIFSSYYYRLAFMDRSPFAPEWRDPDALDHPPFAKYAFGFAFSLARLVPGSLSDKIWWRTHDLDLVGREDFVRHLTERTPRRTLFIGRLVSCLCFAACAWLVYSACAAAFSQAIGIWAGVLFALHPLALELSGQAVADGIFLVLLLGSIRTQQALLARLAAGGRAPLHALLAGACMALLFLTKISGFAALPAAAAALALAGKESGKAVIPAKRRIAAGLGMLSAWALISYAGNPSWWSSPFGFAAEMFRYRLDRVALQSGVFFQDALPGPFLGLSAALRRIFFDWDAVFLVLKVPALLLLASFGLVQSLRSARRTPPGERVLLLNAAVWMPATVAAFRLDWDRYLLPLVPFVLIFAARGLGEAHRALVSPESSRALIPAGAALALAIFLALFSRSVTRESYLSRHPDWERSAQTVYLRKQLEFHPDDPDLWLALARTDELLGNAGRAQQDWAEYRKAAAAKQDGSPAQGK
jgi:hypothetical protein